jgi:hypothetical protein
MLERHSCHVLVFLVLQVGNGDGDGSPGSFDDVMIVPDAEADSDSTYVTHSQELHRRHRGAPMASPTALQVCVADSGDPHDSSSNGNELID